MKMLPSEPFADAANGAASQVGALCWRMHKGQVQVLLITSRDSGRWLIPKGWPIAGLTSAGSAAREAWEEAGVEGKVQEATLGQFVYDKAGRTDLRLQCTVAVHALHVQALKARYPEARQRRRAWFAAPVAADLVAEPELQHLLRRVGQEPRLLRNPA
jgi:8-oxo-dGTP pyrophosphatase MutT (NUDIX family)